MFYLRSVQILLIFLILVILYYFFHILKSIKPEKSIRMNPRYKKPQKRLILPEIKETDFEIINNV